MNREKLRSQWETLEGEYLKSAAEISLHGLAKHQIGRRIIDMGRGGERIADPRLNIEVCGIDFESPVMVGAGWDKKGRSVDGLYHLGFAGTEVGAVLLFGQFGNPRPRLFIDKQTRSVGLNRLGFNALDIENVVSNLEGQQRPGVTGINMGVNKRILEHFPDQVPRAYAKVVEYTYDYGDYFVINVSSPNTPGLRDQLQADQLREIIQEVKNTLRQRGGKPLFVKFTVDMALSDLELGLQVCVEEGVEGVIDTNTTVDEQLKAKYGWRGQAGGLSGNDPEYRRRATDRMKFITRQTRNSGLARIAAGGINLPEHAIERIEAGAQVIQVVTAIRQHKAKTAEYIKLGLLSHMDKHGFNSLEEMVGIAA